MANSNSTPAEGPPALSGPEEHLNEVEFLNTLHAIYKKGREIDSEAAEEDAKLGKTGLVVDARFLVMDQPSGDSSVPLAYDKMVLEPREDSLSVERITLKVPKLDRLQADIFVLPAGAEQWNDIVLEIDYPDKQRGRYLYNSRGIVPFPDVEALDEAAASDPSAENADLFYVKEGYVDWTVPPVTASWLEGVFATCAMQRQINASEEQ